MFTLIDPEIWHLLFALAGAVLGWWLRHQQGAPGVPPELADLLRNLLDRKKQQDAHGLLEELLAVLRAPQPGSPAPRSGGGN